MMPVPGNIPTSALPADLVARLLGNGHNHSQQAFRDMQVAWAYQQFIANGGCSDDFDGAAWELLTTEVRFPRITGLYRGSDGAFHYEIIYHNKQQYLRISRSQHTTYGVEYEVGACVDKPEGHAENNLLCYTIPPQLWRYSE